MNILPINFMISPKKSMNKIRFKSSAAEAILTEEKREASKQIDDIRAQIRTLDKTRDDDIAQIDSQERQIKDDEEKQISALEKEKDDLRSQTNRDKSTLQNEISTLQNQYHV